MLDKKTTKNSNPLGRGLEGLFKHSEIEEKENNNNVRDLSDEKRVWSIPVEKLVANKKQPRKTFNKETLLELANSIREKGVIQPILARKRENGFFEIIAGERRWRASQEAGLKEVPVVLRKSNDKDTLEVALIENIQRQDLNPIEEAEAYQFLLESHSMTQKQVAQKVGKDRVTVANSLRLLGLAPRVREMVVNLLLSAGHGRALLSVEEKSEQLQMAKKIVTEKLSVRAVEILVAKKNRISRGGGHEEPDASEKMVKLLVEELQRKTGTKVKIDYNKGKGRVSVCFYSDDELGKIVEMMGKGCR